MSDLERTATRIIEELQGTTIMRLKQVKDEHNELLLKAGLKADMTLDGALSMVLNYWYKETELR